ncbi:transglutaminase domain-containing protein [Leptospira levettii]|uniref:Transglutaminase domain-containing protein n=1 Tax=Leptospira levettii TaxID=2023178 RepID=A0AAW5V1B2_9LEPT|nr:transglutaminase domain-containing protein [Leptospira levettii]MCW7464085.1 transglutaminase domain-containing protein [Leptospira levettii]MCW7495845.1 transglutaminase domain-containing protein [Leptospira levettii]MCW7511729.1 transglutaminase domain-containing protein [Leptospira levettii]MCW7515486.1 transglutaminase domain-containing protein [Leptospira levettii]TGM32881.1 transglutaminase domain-containing protein [Leptospira levettii]
MKHWILGFLIVFTSGSLLAMERGEVPFEWKQIGAKYEYDPNFSFPDAESVELFESLLQVKSQLYFQTKNKDKEFHLYQYDLPTKKITPISWDKGRVLGWALCSGSVYVQTKQKLYAVSLDSFVIQKEYNLTSKSNGWKDFVCVKDKMFRLDKDQLEVLDVNSFEKISELPLPMKSVQRIIEHSDSEILLVSSFAGNTIQVFSLEEGTTTKEWKFPTNHRALFKMVSLGSDRFLIFDPITKIYGEWFFFDEHFFPIGDGLFIRSDEKAVRFSPIKSNLEYQLDLTSMSDIPESNFHVILPKKDTYAQELREESFYSPSTFSLDDFGNRTLTVKVPPMKEGESKVISVYRGKLTRYKIHWKLGPGLIVNREENESKHPNELRDDWFVKLEDPIVVTKRNELFQDKTSIKELLMETSQYVSSIPYKSGKFESAPNVIQKNNGGCTEHSYVTMSLLRGKGIPARLVWNYLPTETSIEMSFNHKYVEVWIDGYGWIPMEPLSPPKSKPGVTYARHLVFAVLPTPTHPKISGGDRLVQLTKDQLSLGKKIKMKLSILKQGEGETSEESLEIQPNQMRNRAIQSGEEVVVP